MVCHDPKTNIDSLIGEVSTIAGSGAASFADGVGNRASFYCPQGICLRLWPHFDIYVADTLNHRIRKVTQSGEVTTIAGSGSYFTCSDGQSLLASFDHPTSVVMDSQGFLYVADCYNNRIRKISPEGYVTTFCGSGMNGLIDKKERLSAFSSPQGLAVDSHDNLFVADTYNHCVRKISPQGVTTTLAGGEKEGYKDGQGVEANFCHPVAVCVDDADYVYVADSWNNCIRRISPDGHVTTVAGGSGKGRKDGYGQDAEFDIPTAIAVDCTGIYVGEAKYNTIRKIT